MGEGQVRRAGLVFGDRRIHAVIRRWTGRRAACGAGRIAVVLDRAFSVADRGTCRDCLQWAQRLEP